MSNRLQLRLRNDRLEKGWSQKKLALKIGVDKSIVSRIETGDLKRPSEKVIKSIAQFFNNADYIIDYWLAGELRQTINRIHNLKGDDSEIILDSLVKIKTAINEITNSIQDRDRLYNSTRKLVTLSRICLLAVEEKYMLT